MSSHSLDRARGMEEPVEVELQLGGAESEKFGTTIDTPY
jgi:hypothetical protein